METHTDSNSIQEEKNECIICLDDVESEWKKLECAHSYHIQCIDKWIRVSATCPLCMTRIHDNYVEEIQHHHQLQIEEIQHNHQQQLNETQNRAILKFVLCICSVIIMIVIMVICNSYRIF